MKLKFDANLEFQLEDISSVTDQCDTYPFSNFKAESNGMDVFTFMTVHPPF